MLKMIENVKNVSPRIKVYGIQIVTRIKSWLGTRVVLETVWMGSADVDRIRFSHQIFFFAERDDEYGNRKALYLRW